MENLNFKTEDRQVMTKKERSLFVAIAAAVIAVIIIAIIGFLSINNKKEIIQGEADANSVRVSGLMPGRVEKFFVTEGQQVHAGDTLAKLYSATVDAKLAQALAMQDAAQAQRQKADAGARRQTIATAYDLLQQAKALLTIREKTWKRMESLYSQNVVSAQKRDEARAGYESALSSVNAARSQYELAKEGAQKEDKMAAQAMENAAKGSVAEVQSILQDQYLIAPCDGVIADIFPHEGELVSTGTPIMNVLKLDDKWLVFNVREELLKDLPMGKEVVVKIPALGMKEVKATVYYIKDMGEYAVWRATKATGDFDSRTFEVRLRPAEQIKELRPGMSVIME